MYSLQKPILQNPFHPLDLSPEDLLRIYNRFQQSRQINKNPQQQLSIDTIAQLISSLKGIKPSYIQKVITQSFIKPTISWNDFLTLLDQQSEIRQKILDWVLFYDEGSIMRYKLKKYMPFRNKVQKGFEFVTFMKIISVGQQKVCIVEVDHQKLILIDVNDGNFKQIDKFEKINSKTNLEGKDNSLQDKNNSKIINKSHLFQQYHQNKKIGLNNSLKIQSEKLIGHSSFQTGGGNLKTSETNKSEDEQAYLKRQRKNIHSVFNIFKDLQIQDSINIVNVTATKLNDRTFNCVHANTIRQAFGDKVVIKNDRIKEVGSKNLAPFEKVQKKLKSLYDQKSKLSYNPYRVKRSFLPNNDNFPSIMQMNDKKLTHERKQKNYILQSVSLSFCPEICCLAIAYHNMEVLILKIGRDLNKMSFEEQDLIKITLQRDHKKNQIIETVKFYHHTILDKWFLLALIRVQFKGEGKSNAAQSYVLGYQIEQIQCKRKTGFKYFFKCNQDQNLCGKQTFRLVIQKFQGTILQIEPKQGIHLLSFNGKYYTFREQYIQNQENPAQSKYWKISNEQKFKNSNLSLSCISIGKSIHKVFFGTNNGNVVLYDPFSHQFKIKKISSHPIVKVQIVGNQGFALTRDQKIIIMNLAKFEDVHTFSTVNEDKLHQKVMGFEYEQKTRQIWTFGSQIKIYDHQTDQSQLHLKRQMQKTYTWRLNKLKNQSLPNKSLKGRIQSKLSNNNTIKNKNPPQLKSSELIISSQKFFIILSQILEVIVIDKSNLKVKFSFILNVPYDAKVMKIAISQSQKLLAVLLFNQNIYIYNIYTQELYLYLKPPNNQKFVSISFLDSKNEYLLASGTQSGKIALIPYSTVPEKPIYYLSYHKNAVNIVQTKNNFLISCCEGGKIGIWQLPFNVIKHEFKLPNKSKYISKIIGFYSIRTIYMKTIEDQLFEINLNTIKLNSCILPGQHLHSQIANVMSVDPITNQLFLVNLGVMTAFTKNSETNQWIQKQKTKVFQDKKKTKNDDSQYGQILQIGIIGSEKAVLFYEGGGAFVYTYNNQKIGKYITFNE